MKKLTSEDVFEIKTLLKEGKLKQKDIAKKFNVSPTTITMIKKGKTFDEIVTPSKEYQKGFEVGYAAGYHDGATHKIGV